jgi:hypothetical protein
MKVRSDAGDLLETARAVFVDELLPALPSDKRYAALMVANAMAIAARDASAPGSGDAQELAAVAALLPGMPAPPDDPAASLRTSNAELARRIRAGAFTTAAQRAQLFACLEAATARRLAISNPKLLKR